MKNHNYFVYICTNRSRKVLYTGITHDLRTRMYQHKGDAMDAKESFAGKYNCYYLVYWERFQYVQHAIDREKEIKGWMRYKKINLINEFNPEWRFLNDEVD